MYKVDRRIVSVNPPRIGGIRGSVLQYSIERPLGHVKNLLLENKFLFVQFLPVASENTMGVRSFTPDRHETSSTSIPLIAMFSLNRIELIGYQTQPVTIRQTPSGASVTDLNLVVPYAFQNGKGEMLTGKSFHTVTIWGSMADIAGQYVKAGSQLFISGRLQTDSWDDTQSGEKRSKTKVVSLDMILLDPKEGQMAAPAGAGAILNCLNRAQVIGNITREPEMRTTTSGQSVLTLGVATNERWKDKASGETKERTEFHNVVVWGDLAKAVQSAAKKGQRVYVSGRVQTRTWETQTGQKRATTEIIADQLSLLGTKNPEALAAIQADSAAAATAAPSAPRESSAQAGGPVPEIKYESEIKPEDLPF